MTLTYTSREVAELLNVSVRTVRYHAPRIGGLIRARRETAGGGRRDTRAWMWDEDKIDELRQRVHRRPGELSTQEVADAAGVTYRMVDYWCRKGLISGQEGGLGSGVRRSWTRAQMRRVELLATASWLKNATFDQLVDWLVEDENRESAAS